MEIQHFFDPATSTLTYVVHDAKTGVVIDPVFDYDPKSARTSFKSAETVANYIAEKNLTIPYVIDTHAHADHLTAMPFFKKQFGARTVTGSRVGGVQRIFRDIYNLGSGFPVDGRQFDLLLDEGQELEVGSCQVRAMHTPGHTPAHMSWQIEDALFVGDTLFMPDYGTARCDFPGALPNSSLTPYSEFTSSLPVPGSLCATTISRRPQVAICDDRRRAEAIQYPAEGTHHQTRIRDLQKKP